MSKIESSPSVGFQNRLDGAFDGTVKDAILEERKLRTDGTSFLDSFRRITFLQALKRVIQTIRNGWSVQTTANKWQAEQDRNTIRPRALRRSADGTAVYAGTVERNDLLKGLKGAVRVAEKSLASRSVDASPVGGSENSARDEISNLTFKGKPIAPYLKAITSRGHELLSGFAAKQFTGANTKDSFKPSNPKMIYDEDRNEVFIEISEYSSMANTTMSSIAMEEEVHARMIVRVSLGDELEVRVVSAEARKGPASSFIEPSESQERTRFNWSALNDFQLKEV